jgi:type II secretory pathway component PulF
VVFLIVGALTSILSYAMWVVKVRLFPKRSLFTPILVATCVLALLLGLVGSFLIPGYEEIFATFGSDLPVQTIILLNDRQLLWLPALLLLGFGYALRTGPNRARYLAVALFVEINLLLLVFEALYAPIFKMGCS